MTHSKESGANVGPSGRDVVNIVSCLSLILSADSALEIPTLVLVGLNKRVETNITLLGSPCGRKQPTELWRNGGSGEHRVTREHEGSRPPAASALALTTGQQTSPQEATARKHGNGRLHGLLG